MNYAKYVQTSLSYFHYVTHFPEMRKNEILIAYTHKYLLKNEMIANLF